VAAFRYRAPLDAMVKRLKFHGDLQLARLLGTLMAERVAQSADVLPEVIVPVPLHPRRLRRRGYNQALELARPIARRLAVPLEWRQVRRVRATDPQTEVPASLRSRNVKDAFAVAPGFCARRVAIVDDVMTTGHTVNELAKALRRAGAAEISVWVCTRAVFGR
jgi:ComF family protein